MVFFQSSSEKQRHASTDAVLETTLSDLYDPAVQANLGAMASRLTSLIEDRYYVPNVRHGIIKPPRKTPETGLAIVSAYPGEELTLDNKLLSMSPDQSERAMNYLGIQGVSPVIASAILRAVDERRQNLVTSDKVIRHDSKNVKASVNAKGIGFGFARGDKRIISRYFNSQPVTLLRVDEQDDLTASTTLSHEMVHVLQSLKNPVEHPHPERAFRRRTKNELEAYHVGSRVMSALYFTSENPTYRDNNDTIHLTTSIIESSRYDTNRNRKDAFAWSDTLEATVAARLHEVGALSTPPFLSRTGQSQSTASFLANSSREDYN